MLTVKELLRDLGIIARTGEDALEAPVRWVHISELADPTPWLSGGELLLTTGLQLSTPEIQREFIARLADHELAGVGFGTGFGHETIPEAMLASAAERGLPLFEVPYELPFIAVTEQAFTRLVNEQYAILRRAITAHERLERLVLSERGLDAVVATLATLVGGSVMVLDPRGEPVVSRAFRRALENDVIDAVAAEIRERARRGERRSFAPSAPGLTGRAMALPVASTGAPQDVGAIPQAWLVAAKDSGGLTEFDRLTLHQAVTIVALEMLRRRIAEDTERRLAGDIIAAAMSGELEGAELARRLEPFGLSRRAAAIVLARAQPGRAGMTVAEAALGAALRHEAASGLVAANGEWICALVSGMEDEDLFTLAERVVRRVGAELGVPVRGGAGRAVAGTEVRRTLLEARCALEARALARSGLRPSGNGRPEPEAEAPLATYRDLGSFQLLLSLQDEDALRLFCDSILGPIESSEGAYGGELMRSLEAFIEENGQWERAAKRLFCHRHTLRYRIRKVEELTGRNLGSARDRIEFWLALRGRELAAPQRTRTPLEV